MNDLLISECITHTACACGILAWAVHLWAALSYGKTSKLIKQQTAKTETGTEPPAPVSVVILAHNQAASLRRNLPAILEQDYEQYEVIVVNNASTDETEDVLQALEFKYPHLHHTFTPSSARYISRKRLSITIGFKAARHDWVLLTEADCRPQTPYWIADMSKSFSPHTQMVLGYANYAAQNTRLSRESVFFRLYHQMQYLPWAAHHQAYRGSLCNLAYRKSHFIAHRGFADDINLVSGAAELLVNRHSTADNTAVNLLPRTRIEQERITEKRLWKQERMYYMETRRHFKKTWAYRFLFNVKQTSPWLFYLSWITAFGLTLVQSQWVLASIGFILLIGVMILKTVLFNRSSKALGEKGFYLALWIYELALPVWHFKSRLSYLSSPRKQFRRKAF